MFSPTTSWFWFTYLMFTTVWCQKSPGRLLLPSARSRLVSWDSGGVCERVMHVNWHWVYYTVSMYKDFNRLGCTQWTTSSQQVSLSLGPQSEQLRFDVIHTTALTSFCFIEFVFVLSIQQECIWRCLFLRRRSLQPPLPLTTGWWGPLPWAGWHGNGSAVTLTVNMTQRIASGKPTKYEYYTQLKKSSVSNTARWYSWVMLLLS